MSFYNNGYNFYSTTNLTVIELNSNISSKFSNVLRGTYTNTKDKRGTPGDLFPAVSISDKEFPITSEQNTAHRLIQSTKVLLHLRIISISMLVNIPLH